MIHFEKSYQDPFDNLAYDEALLTWAEDHPSEEILRFWESPDYFVVLGTTSRKEEDVHVKQCRKDNIQISRRNSGGGTVLQGPGSLNYSLILLFQDRPALSNIRESYGTIFYPIIQALSTEGCEVQYFPVSDLAIGGKKFSGNAQARKKHAMLHHGTILYDFNIDLVTKYLAMPEKIPSYREARSHKEFLTNIKFSRKDICARILKAYASEPGNPPDLDDRIRDLKARKYAQSDWTDRF